MKRRKFLIGPFETGATNADTNNFILTAINHYPSYKKILKKASPVDIYYTEYSDVFDSVTFMNIVLEEVEEYFENYRKDIKV